MTAWAGSTRRDRLPANWPKLRAQVMKRAGGLCENCSRPGNQCDHISPGDNHNLSNLQWLCVDCHNRKSSAEGAAARLPRTRTPQPHPGLITPRERAS